MRLRPVVTLAVALLALLRSVNAWAWQEAHQTGDSARITVEPNGSARVRHDLRWHVVRGPLRSIDLANVDPAAVLDPNVPISTEDGRELSAHAARRDDRTVRITIDEPRQVMRGNFTFDVEWRTDLVSSRTLVREGGTWRLVVSAPVATDGFDAARTLLDLPEAPEAPVPILADTGAVDETAVQTCQREAGRDVLELVRPHVARGESVTWTVRIDPRALRALTDPRLHPSIEGTAFQEHDRVREASTWAAILVLALAFGLLVAHKTRAFVAACAERGAAARGLLPLPHGMRAPIAGLALAAGVWLQMVGEPAIGALLIAAATLATALRAPSAKPVARGPGRWVNLDAEEAFRTTPPGGHWLDIGSRQGRFAAMAVGLAVVGAGLTAKRFDPVGHWLVLIDAVPLAALLLTGRASQLPPHGARSAFPWFARAFRRMSAMSSLRVAPLARVRASGSPPDELRLSVLPRIAMPGLVSVEVGVAWSSTPVGWVATPEVLARVLEGSAAATKLTQSRPEARLLPGRRADERVERLLPRSPSMASAVALARQLADAMTDRRATLPRTPWTAPERRAASVGGIVIDAAA